MFCASCVVQSSTGKWFLQVFVVDTECEVWSVKREERSGASNVTCETRHQFRRVHARTGLAGALRMQVL